MPDNYNIRYAAGYSIKLRIFPFADVMAHLTRKSLLSFVFRTKEVFNDTNVLVISALFSSLLHMFK